ncbi:hypothetical protein ACUDA6_27020 [Pseudomonas ceruminis]|uniref:hypothetical protein n=1 Tax=Pseudomonas ceruminis TaxID=2740516 RepID=UPI00404701AD
MEVDTTIKLAGVVLALSGWTKVYLDHIGNRPKFVGRILGVLKGQLHYKGQTYTSLLLYPYITNARKNEVHILEYELFYKEKWYSSWKRAARAYGLENHVDISSTSIGGEKLSFGKLKEKLIYSEGGIVKHGVPLHGWIPFLGPSDFYTINAHKYKLILTDAFGKKHSLALVKNKGVSPHILMELSTMPLPEHMFDEEFRKRKMEDRPE